jgi:Spy/CpxP family protein refolding chaperone
MKSWFRGIALSVIAAALLPAQTTTTTNGPTVAQIVANKVAHLTKLLTLTTDQVTQATTIFTTEETALQALRTSVQTAQAALKTAVEANSATGITAAATQLGTLDSQSIEARATGDAAFYAILTSAQQTIFNEVPKGGPGGPPGGFGGGPGRGPGPGPR